MKAAEAWQCQFGRPGRGCSHVESGLSVKLNAGGTGAEPSVNERGGDAKRQLSACSAYIHRSLCLALCLAISVLAYFPALALAKANQGGSGAVSQSPAEPEARPAAADKATSEVPLQKAIFAAGCFWHVEDTFRHLPGVVDAISGYTGGNVKNPTYKLVCTGTTHHAEAVEVLYDPKRISYEQLLNAFWDLHDPTTMNHQGPDFGEQYRSAIFYLNDAQKKAASASRDKLVRAKLYTSPIVTQIVPAGEFYKAEAYHQRYFEMHPGDPRACHR